MNKLSMLSNTEKKTEKILNVNTVYSWCTRNDK